jgi:hypothetical protein
MIRLLLVLAVVVVFALCVAGMWVGWRNRARRQAAILADFPQPPAWVTEAADGDGAGDDATAPPRDLLEPMTGVYVGSTIAGDWQNRIAIGDIGFRAAARLRLSKQGLVIERTGASPLWIPAESLVSARRDRALAGKVMGIEGLFVVRWQLGDQRIDSGVRGDDKNSYGDWVDAVSALVARTEHSVPAGGAREGDGSC